MNEHMTCINITEPGGPEVLVPQKRSVPVPGDDEVLIEVHAAGVNRPDVVQRMGRYNPPPGVTDIPGLEVAGIVVALGNSVEQVKIGDKVCALVAGGGYAEYCVAPIGQVLPIPSNMSMVEAAGIPENYFTVWSNIFDCAKLKKDEIFMVHGGSSGIGNAAIQLAKNAGAKIITTAGSDQKCKICRELGADLAINYREEDFVSLAKDFAGKAGVDVILDMVGGNYVQGNIDCLGRDGRLVQIAFLNGSKVQLDLLPVMLKRLVLTGATLRPRSLPEKEAIAKQLRTHVWPSFESGDLKVIVHQTYNLSGAAEAHALMESSQHIGKIILDLTKN